MLFHTTATGHRNHRPDMQCNAMQTPELWYYEDLQQLRHLGGRFLDGTLGTVQARDALYEMDIQTQQDMEAHNQADLRKQAARPACNKWQAQFYEDLQQLRHFDATYWILDEISPNLHELVKNEDVRHAFINFDIKEVGQREITMKINVHEIDANATRKLVEEEVEYVCDMLNE